MAADFEVSSLGEAPKSAMPASDALATQRLPVHLIFSQNSVPDHSALSNTFLSLPKAIFHSHCFSSSSSPSSSHWFSLLRTAVSTSNLCLGKCVHAQIIRSGENPDRILTNYLISMYSKCGSISLARHQFDRTPDRDLVTWNSVLAAYAQSVEADLENFREGFHLFRLLRKSLVSVSKLTLAPLLKLCLLSANVWASEAVHGYGLKIGLIWNVLVSGALVNIYSKFGRIREARVLFDGMLERDVVLWNIMLKAYVKTGFEVEALHFFSEFHRSGLSPAAVSVRSVLSGINDVGSDIGKRHKEQVQAYATKLFLYDDGSNVIMWNKSLSEFIQNGDNWCAVECFRKMIASNVEYDNVTLVVALSAALGINELLFTLQIHVLALKSGFDSDVSVANSLVNVYSKMGFISLAQKVFANMRERNLISWNTIISGCAQSGLEKESPTLFIDLLRSGLRPDHFTLASVLKACSLYAGDLHLCAQIHVHAIKNGTIADSFVMTALIDVYSKGGKTTEAEFLFANKDQFDLATWNTMMFGHISSNDSPKALKLFGLIHKSGERPDQITLATVAKACGYLVWLEQGKQIHAYAIKFGFDKDLYVNNGILDMYAKCGNMVDARLVFSDIPAPDDVAWTTLISRCVENGDEDHALSGYHKMKLSGVPPDEHTFATLIKASSSLTALEQGKQIHADVIKLDCASDPFVETSLIDMYAKCGNIEDAYCLFRRTNAQNVGLWNAMMIGLAQHGKGEEALNLFKVMNCHCIAPDRVTFIGVLSACGHSGLISEACKCFHSMQQDYAIEPEIEHYSYLVDALGRAGCVKEARKLITSMPFEASASMYRALLGACKVQCDTKVGKSHRCTSLSA